jgi:amidohydrolase
LLVDDLSWNTIEPWMVQIRRTIHRRPELGLETPETQHLVETALDEMGIAHTRPITYGVKAVIAPDRPGPALLLRADMDALPIQENNALPFKSEIPGRMHACGHDCHTAMLLGAARYLRAHEAELRRPVVLMFQPAEEGPGGAVPMLEAGILNDPAVEQACMVHVDSDLPAGVLGLRAGPAMGSCDDFTLTIHGRGGHGSTPHQGVDAIFVASAIIQGLQAIVSREQDSFDPLVVSVGTIHGGYRENIIADRVEMTGTIRCMSPASRKRAVRRVREVTESIARTYNARAELVIEDGYPVFMADVPWTRRARSIIVQELGEEAVSDIPPTLGVEDFAFVAERVPAFCISVGIAGAGFTTGLHSAGLIVDERGLRAGAAAFAALALKS